MARPTRATVMISGGNSGIGLGLAKAFAERGASIGILDLDCAATTASDLQSRTAAHSARFQAVTADVRDDAAVQAGVAELVGELGAPDLVISSAGVQGAGLFEELPAAQFERVMAINCLGSRNVAAAILPQMARGSRFAFISSMAGIMPNYGYSAYTTSKFAIMGLAGSLRLEYRPRGIGISVICPPEVASPLVDEERLVAHELTTSMKQVVGSLTLDQAVRGIVRGLDAERDVIVPSARAAVMRRAYGAFPGISSWVSDRIVAQYMRSAR